MLNSVSSTNLLQNYALKPATDPQKPEATKTADQPEIAQDIVKKETADATKAYAAGIIAPPPKAAPEKKSLDELKADLVAQGKVEGKDFKIENKEDKQGVYGHELVVLENDKPLKSYYYDNNGAAKEDFQFVTEYSYPMNTPTLADGTIPKLKQTETSYGADGEFHFRATRYERENSPYKDDIVNYDTKPFELEEKLKAEGIKFARDIEYSNDNENYNTFMVNKITAFDPKTDEMIRYEFTYNKADDSVVDVTKNIIDKDGSIKSYIAFRKDETAFVNFRDDFIA